MNASESPMDEGIHYFGAMTASISHEIKNCLAIMNENTGLAGDLVAMAAQRPLDPAKFGDIVTRLQNQIHRTDRILKHLNTFSHSMDKPVQPVDLFEAVELAAALGARICANRQIQVQPQCPDQPVNINTNLFSLLLVIWTVLDGTTQELPPGTALVISVLKRQDQPCIVFSAGENFGNFCETMLSSQACRDVLTRISAGFSVDREKQEVELRFPSPGPAAR